MARIGDARPQILIVEDDEAIGTGLTRALENAGYEPHWCAQAGAVLARDNRGAELVLLDLGLPDLDGLELCRRLRLDHPTLPILILTARGSETDVVVGLDAGADDYLIKPFRLAELLARLRALLRRNASSETASTVVVGDLEVDPAARRVRVAGDEIQLRPKEFDLLHLLVANAGAVVTRERAMDVVWDEHWFGSTKTLDVTLASLRQHLGEAGAEHSRITTLRGVGYRLEQPGAAR